MTSKNKEFSVFVILSEEKLPNGDYETRVSHGIDFETGKAIVLEGVTNPLSIGAWFNSEINEWVL
jgi:hypothetical protein